ncbi:MAG: hypothetical protein GWP06_15210 [Actinobacteria bacterium]|nr:hypothetical protein [Actinomycetota bacterium]
MWHFKIVWITLFAIAGTAFAQQSMVKYEETFNVRGKSFEVNLDIDGGQVEIVRGDHGHECRVSMEYTKEKCNGDVRFNKKRNRLDVELKFRNWSFWKKEHGENSFNARILVELPNNVSIDLNSRIKAGEIDLTLGGMKIRNFELKNWAGNVTVDFDEPNRIAMNEFDVDIKVGNVKLLNLGNANFEEADINGGIGEMQIDFNGNKIKRSMARIDLDVGETTIDIPDQIGVKIKVSKFSFLSNVDYPHWFNRRGKYYYSKNYDESDKSLYLVISQGIGQLKIRVD